MTASAPILVTAATGKTGRRVADQLERAGVRVRRASRRAEVPFDWSDPGTWPAALDGVRAVYVAPAEGSLAVPAFIATAAARGVEQIVVLSARAVDVPGYYDDQTVLAPQHLAAERAAHTSGMRWTVLRPGWFQQNFDEGDFAEGLAAGELALPIPDGAAAFIDAEDIAAVAVAAFEDPVRLHGATLELTGPHPVSLPDAVARIASATGRTIRYRPITADEYRTALLDAGVSQHDTAVAVTALSPIRDGREGRVTTTVADVLGRPAGTFDAYVARTFTRTG